MKQLYLSPLNAEHVFNDGSLLSYSLERRGWILHKDGLELVLRDTVLPQPDEIVKFVKENVGLEDVFRKMNLVISCVFPNRPDSFYEGVVNLMEEALLGVADTAQGAVPVYDLSHVALLFGDREPSLDKTGRYLKSLVLTSCAHGAAVFLTIPPTAYDDMETEGEDFDEAL